MSFIVAVVVILGLAAFTFSFAGFGFPWVALPLLSLVMPVREAVVFHYPFVLALVIYHAWRFRGHITWRRHWAVLAGAAVGMPLGVWFLLKLPEAGLRKGLAIFIVLSVLALSLEQGRSLIGRIASSPWGAALIGLVSGWLQGAYAIGGPPAVLYIMASAKVPEEIKGFLGVYFTFICIVSASLLGLGGLFSLHWLKMSLYFSPAVIGGVMLGAWAFRKASRVWFRRVVYAMLVAAAVLLWLKS